MIVIEGKKRNKRPKGKTKKQTKGKAEFSSDAIRNAKNDDDARVF